jgi:hypothetical protein
MSVTYRNRRLNLGIGVAAMIIGCSCSLLAIAVLAFAPSTSRGITLGQIDTFEDGTTEGWNGGIQLGGPAGSSDHYLMITPFAGSGGPRPATNSIQWTGNYISAGVTGIEMDLIDLSTPTTSTASFFVSMLDATPPIGGSFQGQTAFFNVPEDGQWHHATFSLTAGSVTSVLANATELDINGNGGSFGVDNIHAVPEPTSISILLSGIVGVAVLRRRRPI